MSEAQLFEVELVFMKNLDLKISSSFSDFGYRR